MHEFRCQSCDATFEELVRSKDDVVRCPECGGEDARKLMSCCRFREPDTGPVTMPHANPSRSRSRSSCAGCAGGNCSTC